MPPKRKRKAPPKKKEVEKKPKVADEEAPEDSGPEESSPEPKAKAEKKPKVADEAPEESAPEPKTKDAKKPKIADEAPEVSATKLESASDSGPVLYIEHCRSCHRFQKRAIELHGEILEHLPNIKLVLNPTGTSRRGSFELSFSKTPTDDADARKLLWTGLKKGPPRVNKYPKLDFIVDAIKKSLKE